MGYERDRWYVSCPLNQIREVLMPWNQVKALCGESIGVSWVLRSTTQCACPRSSFRPFLLSPRYELVWDATARIYHEMVSHEGWLSAKKAEVVAFQDMTMQVRDLATCCTPPLTSQIDHSPRLGLCWIWYSVKLV